MKLKKIKIFKSLFSVILAISFVFSALNVTFGYSIDGSKWKDNKAVYYYDNYNSAKSKSCFDKSANIWKSAGSKLSLTKSASGFGIYMTGGIDSEGYSLQMEEDPLMKSNEEFLLFARENDDGTFTILGGPQGRFIYDNGRLTSLGVKKAKSRSVVNENDYLFSIYLKDEDINPLLSEINEKNTIKDSLEEETSTEDSLEEISAEDLLAEEAIAEIPLDEFTTGEIVK